VSKGTAFLGWGAIVVATAALAAFAAVGGAATKTVKVTITDTKITLSPKTAPTGKTVFAVKNLGKKIHNFRIGGKTTKALAHGKTATLTVSFAAAKSYPYLSTLPKGQTKGLKGVFKVTKAPQATTGNAKAGKAVFTSSGCGSCHTMAAAGASGTIGPNLDTSKPSVALITSRVKSGKGAMPPFGSTLTAAQIADVATYVYASTH
jgi:mono/diheme cytochrome c family protein